MKLSSSENLSLLVPCDGQNSSLHSPTFSACNGDTTSLGALNIPNQNFSEYDIGDFMLPESMFSSYGEGIFVPDIIESTVSVLSSADVTMHQSQIGDSCEDVSYPLQCSFHSSLSWRRFDIVITVKRNPYFVQKLAVKLATCILYLKCYESTYIRYREMIHKALQNANCM